jgi:hypothetical protein
MHAANHGAKPRKLIAIRSDVKILSWLRKTAEQKGLPYQLSVKDILAEQTRTPGYPPGFSSLS